MNQSCIFKSNKKSKKSNNKINGKEKKCEDRKYNQCCALGYVIRPTGPTGATGPQGLPGIQGEMGPTGPAGGVLNYADFYALMPLDNAAALTITPLAGGTEFVSAHLVITQIA